MNVRWFLAAVLTITLGCTPVPSPAPPPSPDGSDAAAQGSCADACAALLRAGCPEGTSGTCQQTMGASDRTREVRTPSGQPLTCAATARVQTPQDAHALGIACRVP